MRYYNVLDNTLVSDKERVFDVLIVLSNGAWAPLFNGVDLDTMLVLFNLNNLTRDPFAEYPDLVAALHKYGVRGFVGFSIADTSITVPWGYRFTDNGVVKMAGILRWKEVTNEPNILT